MSDINTVIISGRLTSDPKLEYKGEWTIGNFAIANSVYAKNGNKTMFINCKCFGKLAEILDKYSVRGNRVLVKGQWRIDYWEKDGVKKNSHYLLADQIQIMDFKKTQQESKDDSNLTEKQIDELDAEFASKITDGDEVPF